MFIRAACVGIITSLVCFATWFVFNSEIEPLPLALRDSPAEPWDLSDFQGWPIAHEEPLGNKSGTNKGIRHVQFQNGRLLRDLYVHFPAGIHQAGSLPCVLVPPSGSNLLTGQSVNGGIGLMEHYLRKKFVVVRYELSGAVTEEADRSLAYQNLTMPYMEFVDAKAGLLNAVSAFEYASTAIDVVDPKKIFVAGYSSGGTHALLFAAHEPRLAGCVAYCPDPDLADFRRDLGGSPPRELERLLNGLNRFVQKAAPLTHVRKIQCPTYIFASRDDPIVEFERVVSFCDTLRKLNSQMMFRWSDSGGHFESYQKAGIKLGSEWMVKILD